MKKTNYVKLILSIVISQLAGIIGSFFTATSVTTWYIQLNKPAFNPPNWVFGPVWILLYILMGIALYLVWNKGLKSLDSKIAILLFGIQFVLNSLWSIFFFGMKSPMCAFIELILLWITILLTIIYFHKISKAAALLLIPYILWVSFAGYLNYSIMILN